jgi:hypothetical protein
MAEELKACSCGSKDSSIGYESPQRYWVECGDCGYKTTDESRRSLAIYAWNTRAQLPSQGGEAVEVVGYRFFHVDHGYIFRRTHIYEGNPSLQAQSLMTVAQHQRIMAASVADPGAVAVQLGGLTGVSHQLGMLSLHFKNTDQLHAALRELRALLANSEGVKKP